MFVCNTYGVLKKNGWRFDFCGLTKGVQTSSMPNSIADIIAVSFAYPKDPKSPYKMAFLTFTDLH